jgi:hypothetical protein
MFDRISVFNEGAPSKFERASTTSFVALVGSPDSPPGLRARTSAVGRNRTGRRRQLEPSSLSVRRAGRFSTGQDGWRLGASRLVRSAHDRSARWKVCRPPKAGFRVRVGCVSAKDVTERAELYKVPAQPTGPRDRAGGAQTSDALEASASDTKRRPRVNIRTECLDTT